MIKSDRINLAGFAISAIPGGLAVGLLTCLCLQFHLNLTITSFFYLIVVVLQSLRGNFALSAFVSLLTVACLDFFFTEPLFSFEVTKSLDILALISYLITGLVITRLTTLARREAAISKNQRRLVDLLYQVARQLLALDPDDDLLTGSVERFREVFDLKAVCLFDGVNRQLYLAGSSSQDLQERTQAGCRLGEDADDEAVGVSIRCLRATGNNIGAVGFEGVGGNELAIGPLAALAAAMLERTRSFQSASRAAAAAQTEVFRAAVLDALAHEFKTPLATILTAAGGLRETQPLLPQQQELAELIEAETSRLTGLTSQVLRTSQLDQNEIKPRLERTSVTGLVLNLVHQYSRECAGRKFEITQDGISTEVLADRDLLELAVKQLLDNACKYSPPDTSVEVNIEGGEHRATVRVLNSGTPIGERERARIFERFYRGSKTQHLAPGSGLGLYFAQKIISAHGGCMELETASTASGKETAFRLTLPLAPSEC
jgi:two-component system, OmpR family, sensor histidine kinase KdpD